MAKVRKMLGSADSDYIVSLMRLIETQSKETIVKWCLKYAEEIILPIYLKYNTTDERPLNALNAAHGWLDGNVKLAEAKKYVKLAYAAAQEAEGNPIEQAAARALGQAAATVNQASHSLGMAFYSAAAVAYDRVGLEESADVYDLIAAQVCKGFEDMLREMAVPNEPNPAKINWNC